MGRCGWGTTTTIHGGGDKSLKRGDQFNGDEFFVPQSPRIEGEGNKILDVSVAIDGRTRVGRFNHLTLCFCLRYIAH